MPHSSQVARNCHKRAQNMPSYAQNRLSSQFLLCLHLAVSMQTAQIDHQG